MLPILLLLASNAYAQVAIGFLPHIREDAAICAPTPCYPEANAFVLGNATDGNITATAYGGMFNEVDEATLSEARAPRTPVDLVVTDVRVNLNAAVTYAVDLVAGPTDWAPTKQISCQTSAAANCTITAPDAGGMIIRRGQPVWALYTQSAGTAVQPTVGFAGYIHKKGMGLRYPNGINNPVVLANLNRADATADFNMSPGFQQNSNLADEQWRHDRANSLHFAYAMTEDAPGAGDSWTPTVEIDDTAAGTTCTFSGATDNWCGAPQAVNLTAKQRLNLLMVESGTVASTTAASASYLLSHTVGDVTYLVGSVNTAEAADFYIAPFRFTRDTGSACNPASGGFEVPVNMTIERLYTHIAAAPDNNDWIVQLCVNGSADSSCSVTLTTAGAMDEATDDCDVAVTAGQEIGVSYNDDGDGITAAAGPAFFVLEARIQK